MPSSNIQHFVYKKLSGYLPYAPPKPVNHLIEPARNRIAKYISNYLPFSAELCEMYLYSLEAWELNYKIFDPKWLAENILELRRVLSIYHGGKSAFQTNTLPTVDQFVQIYYQKKYSK